MFTSVTLSYYDLWNEFLNRFNHKFKSMLSTVSDVKENINKIINYSLYIYHKIIFFV